MSVSVRKRWIALLAGVVSLLTSMVTNYIDNVSRVEATTSFIMEGQ